MPELPDITLYIERLSAKVLGQPLQQVRLASPFVLRTAVPPLSQSHGRTVQGFERIGKRIVFDMGDELFLVLHLMIAGRLRWREPGAPIHKKLGLLAFDFPNGSLMLTEASSKKRAALHVIQGREALAAVDPGGIDVMRCSAAEFSAALTRENHTVKRTLTDPRVLSGIGNAYSDEILHHARMSPAKLTQKLGKEELERLHQSCKTVLAYWTDKLRDELGPDAFPEQVTAFRDGMAVHGRYGKPCPVCGASVQRIAYADNETNYCARCQTDGKLLADRSLSRLLKNDWPKTLSELEEKVLARPAPAKPSPSPNLPAAGPPALAPSGTATKRARSAAKTTTAAPRASQPARAPSAPESTRSKSATAPNKPKRR